MNQTLFRAFRVAPLAVLLLVPWVAAGCHRATEQDCEKILDRMVELELKDQGVVDSQTVAERKAAARAKKHDDLIRSCVGKRLPQSALECIDEATTPDEITEKCLR